MVEQKTGQHPGRVQPTSRLTLGASGWVPNSDEPGGAHLGGSPMGGARTGGAQLSGAKLGGA